uniref:Uncharacterized protein n=1 Tax=Cucumis melo TaxID=3656 RepID=A0A9I9E7F7_CUCME
MHNNDRGGGGWVRGTTTTGHDGLLVGEERIEREESESEKRGRN